MIVLCFLVGLVVVVLVAGSLFFSISWLARRGAIKFLCAVLVFPIAFVGEGFRRTLAWKSSKELAFDEPGLAVMLSLLSTPILLIICVATTAFGCFILGVK